ncbi:sulfurtransferase complex subunit TusD [Marinobacter orientalis]|uniref:Sulfurtransferase complex subunit TusD n=1 Tax=Marinobacter orientalis TaxID=1928859 RepID=A0A7Y0RCF8_9GAMM|nr:sulfurtransferase complex subunit TusD [Marinobacter orientalis]NMT63689.1 sulfurtransferase complex subunit TusD [Marinobacter orientalis]TGX49804.1 sulfurtransferase complex subunit TusD [Marinobacter orientalis]
MSSSLPEQTQTPAPAGVFTLVITGAPYSSQAPQTALGFARAALAANKRIDRIFLYGDGVHLASALSVPPSDELNLSEAWAAFLAENSIAGVACIASALRRGLVNDSEMQRYGLPGSNLRAPFEIAGLGEWVDSAASGSRVIYFHKGG